MNRFSQNRLLCGIAVAMAMSANAEVAFEEVLRTGTPSPDGNGVISTVSRSYAVGRNAAAVVQLSGTAGGSADDSAIVVYQGGALRLVAREGQPAPDGNGTYARLTLSSTPRVDLGGTVVFSAGFDGTAGGSSDDSGLLAWEGGSTSIVIREGDPRPGGGPGTVSRVEAVSMTLSGDVFFLLDIAGGADAIYSRAPSSGVFGGSISEWVAAGDAHPDGDGTFSEFDWLAGGFTDSSVAFGARLAGTSGGAADNEGQYTMSSPSATPVKLVRTGDPAPDGNGTVLLEFFDQTVYVGGGVALGTVTVTGSAAGKADGQVLVYFGGGGAQTIVARSGGVAAGGNGRYDFLSPALIDAFSATPTGFFTASLSGTSGGTADDSGIFRFPIATPAAVSAWVREGDPDPVGSPYNTPVGVSGLGGFYTFATSTSGAPPFDADFYLEAGGVIEKLIGDGAPYGGETPADVDGFSGLGLASAGLEDTGSAQFSVGTSLDVLTLFHGDDGIAYVSEADGEWDDGTGWSKDFAPVFRGAVTIAPNAGVTVGGPGGTVFPRRVDLDATGFLPAELRLRPGGILMPAESLTIGNGVLAGAGQVQGAVDAGAGSLIRPDGAMGLGDPADAAGFTSTGRIDLNGQRLTLADQNGALLAGEVDLNSGTLVFAQSGTNAGTIRGSGRIEGPLANTGELKLIGDHLVFRSNVTNAASTGLINARDTLLDFIGGLNNEGSLAFSFGTSDVFGDISQTGAGRIVVSGGSDATFWGDVTHFGADIRVSEGATAVYLGTVSGPGSFSGTGTNFFEGAFLPGASPARVTFGGGVSFGPGSTLEIELGGRDAGAGYDQLTSPGVMTLRGGGLRVTLIDGFAPEPGDRFAILDAGSLVGEFGDVALPALPAGGFWDTRRLSSDGLLGVTAVPPSFPEWQDAYGVGAEQVLGYLLGRDPRGAHGAPTVATVSDTGDLVLEFRIPDPASADAVYEVQASDDLGGGTWRTIATKRGEDDWDGGALVEVETTYGGFQTVRVSGAGGERFLRLTGQVVSP